VRRPGEPLFLARQGYRLRRLGDTARLLPTLGAALFVLPLLGSGDPGWTTAGVGLFLFAVWAGLILAAVALGRALGSAGGGGGERDGDG
jgi:hypothetical protein